MKKEILFIAALMSLISLSNAQIVFRDDAEELVTSTLEKGFVIVEQMYQLKDSRGNVYGLNGKEEFGTVYSSGILTDEGLVVTDKAIHPWNYDSNFDQYKNDKKYEPVLYETDIKLYGEKESVRMECAEESSNNLGVNLYLRLCFRPEGGLALSDTTGKVDGWMVWAMHPTSEEMSKDLDYRVYVVHMETVDVKDNGIEVNAPQNMEKVIGGFFVVPHIAKAGSVCFELCGVANKVNDDWKLQSVIQPKKTEEEQPKVGSNDEEAPKPSGGKLTPAGKKGKKGNKK